MYYGILKSTVACRGITFWYYRRIMVPQWFGNEFGHTIKSSKKKKHYYYKQKQRWILWSQQKKIINRNDWMNEWMYAFL